MKSIKRIFFLLSFISVSYLSTFAQENQSYFLHTIEKYKVYTPSQACMESAKQILSD